MKVQTLLHQFLETSFSPLLLEIEDQSSRHKDHAQMKGALKEEETHFKIVLVSRDFEGVSRVSREREVQKRLKNALGCTLFSKIHALSLTLLTPEESQNHLFSKTR